MEEQLKRELQALGGAIVPLPEHDDLPMPTVIVLARVAACSVACSQARS